MKVIIDTDCGVDDTFAIAAALKMYEVVAITCVSGNVHVDQAVNNVGVLLEKTGNQHIPIFRGCDNFILENWKPSPYEGHGKDGMGNLGLKSNIKPQEESAVDALIRLSKEHEIYLFAIGPATNVALACLIDSDFPNRVSKFTFMGGAHQCKGNTGMASEFNVHCDPEAAHICLNKFKSIDMVTWETCYKSAISWEYFKKLEESSNKGNKVNKFLVDISKNYIDLHGKVDPGFIICDMVAIMAPICEDEGRTMNMNCRVELTGKYTRGATVFDWRERGEGSNSRIVKIDMKKIYEFCDCVFLE